MWASVAARKDDASHNFMDILVQFFRTSLFCHGFPRFPQGMHPCLPFITIDVSFSVHQTSGFYQILASDNPDGPIFFIRLPGAHNLLCIAGKSR